MKNNRQEKHLMAHITNLPKSKPKPQKRMKSNTIKSKHNKTYPQKANPL
jgi:hypothetical protein